MKCFAREKLVGALTLWWAEPTLHLLENGAVHLEKDVQEKFAKLFGGSVSEVGDGEEAGQ